MTARERVIAAATRRGLPIHEESLGRGTTLWFGYYQVSFTDAGNWWPECAHGPRLRLGRAALRDLLDALDNAPDHVLAPQREMAR